MSTPFDEYTPQEIGKRWLFALIDVVTTYKKTTVGVLVVLLGGAYIALSGTTPFSE